MPPRGGVGTGEGVLADDDGLPPPVALSVPRGDDLGAPDAERDGDAFADAEHATSGIARSTIATRRMITGGSLEEARIGRSYAVGDGCGHDGVDGQSAAARPTSSRCSGWVSGPPCSSSATRGRPLTMATTAPMIR